MTREDLKIRRKFLDQFCRSESTRKLLEVRSDVISEHRALAWFEMWLISTATAITNKETTLSQEIEGIGHAMYKAGLSDAQRIIIQHQEAYQWLLDNQDEKDN